MNFRTRKNSSISVRQNDAMNPRVVNCHDAQLRLHQDCIGTTTTAYTDDSRCELCERLSSSGETSETIESTECHIDGPAKRPSANSRTVRTKQREIITCSRSLHDVNPSLNCASSVVRWNANDSRKTFTCSSRASILWISFLILTILATVVSAEIVPANPPKTISETLSNPQKDGKYQCQYDITIVISRGSDIFGKFPTLAEDTGQASLKRSNFLRFFVFFSQIRKKLITHFAIFFSPTELKLYTDRLS